MTTIDVEVLNKLPRGKVMMVTTVKDMDGNDRDAIKYTFRDEWGGRVAYFDINTGEYLGEA